MGNLGFYIHVLTIIFLVSMVTPVWGAGNRDPETGRIKILYVGEPTGSSPYPVLEADPLILPYPVKASACVFSFRAAQRSMRQYMPRTYDDLSSHQVFILSDANSRLFSPVQLKWYLDSVREGDSGLVMIGGNEAFGGRAGYSSWGMTPVGEVLPVECIPGEWFGHGEVIILEDDHPLVESVPIGDNLEWMKRYDGNRVEVREGANELARVDPATEEIAPFWVTWRYGEGRTFAMTGDWTPAGGAVFMRWEYYGDFAINLMLFLSENELPRDLDTVREARRKFLEFRSQKAYLFNIMEFGERFGANMNPLSEIIDRSNGEYKRAEEVYIELEVVPAIGFLDSALKGLSEGVKKAIDLKDQAMRWIFVIEWSTVSATFFICGFVIWTLMVRRRLYRETGVTRFEGR